ncbi:MAG: hypothetical protein ABIJ86_08875 [Spirochaetota bacterium]
MKRILILGLSLLVATGPLFAQAAASITAGTDPQFALTLLTGYFEDEAKDRRAGGIIMTSLGSIMFGGGAAAASYAFMADPASFGSPEELMMLRGASIATAGAGALVGGIGIALLAQPADSYKQKYAFMYIERDPVVQEAMAYGLMKDMAEEARRGRIVGAITNLATPLATIGVSAAIAGSSGDWEDFNESVLGSLSWSIPSVITGILLLTTGKSDAERLLDSYRSTVASYRSGRD